MPPTDFLNWEEAQEVSSAPHPPPHPRPEVHFDNEKL